MTSGLKHLRHTGPEGQRDCTRFVARAHESKPLPLTVMLHGCKQYAADFSLDTDMSAIAEQYRSLVACLIQPRSASLLSAGTGISRCASYAIWVSLSLLPASRVTSLQTSRLMKSWPACTGLQSKILTVVTMNRRTLPLGDMWLHK